MVVHEAAETSSIRQGTPLVMQIDNDMSF